MGRLRKDERVVAYKSNGSLFRVYLNTKQASRSLKKSDLVISRCIRGEIDTAYSYIFRKFKVNEIPESIPPLQEKKKTISKRVASYTLDGQYVKSYRSINEAGRQLHKDTKLIRDCLKGKHKDTKLIRDCLKGKYMTAYGYRWRYIKENLPHLKKVSIYQYDTNGKLIQKYPSVRDASLALLVSISMINTAIRENRLCKGYRFKRVIK